MLVPVNAESRKSPRLSIGCLSNEWFLFSIVSLSLFYFFRFFHSAHSAPCPTSSAPLSSSPVLPAQLHCHGQAQRAWLPISHPPLESDLTQLLHLFRVSTPLLLPPPPLWERKCPSLFRLLKLKGKQNDLCPLIKAHLHQTLILILSPTTKSLHRRHLPYHSPVLWDPFHHRHHHCLVHLISPSSQLRARLLVHLMLVYAGHQKQSTFHIPYQTPTLLPLILFTSVPLETMSFSPSRMVLVLCSVP